MDTCSPQSQLLLEHPTAIRLSKALPAAEWRAASLWLGTFFPYQLRWILDWSRFALLLKARQIGASHSFAAASVLWAMLGEHTTVVSKGEREAIEVLEKARRHAQALAALGSRWAAVVRPSKENIELTSGGRITALPATSGARGYSANVILDEFAYHPDPEKVWDAASAATTHGFRLRVLSTPNGFGNLFEKTWNNRGLDGRWSKHIVTIDEAVRDGLKIDESQCWDLARGDPRLFDQLFRCSFLASGRSFFDQSKVAEDLQSATAPHLTQHIESSGAKEIVIGREKVPAIRIWHAPEPGRQYVIGVDASEGTGGDAGTGIVFERGSGRHCATIWGQIRPWELARIVAAVGVKYNGALVAPERNNHGGTVIRALEVEQNYKHLFEDRDGKLGFLTSEVSRGPALDTIEQSYRSGAFKTSDKFLLSEMRTFIVNDRGRAEASSGAHDDLVMAAAIAWDITCRAVARRPQGLGGWVA